MPAKKFNKGAKAQEAVLTIIRDINGGTAYDVMPIMIAEEEEARGALTDTEKFAISQRVSAACSELHADGRLHAVGTKENESSGEEVTLYAIPAPAGPCKCGACPDGGKGYKARYEQLLATAAADKKKLEGQVEFLIMRNTRLQEQVTELKGRLGITEAPAAQVIRVGFKEEQNPS